MLWGIASGTLFILEHQGMYVARKFIGDNVILCLLTLHSLYIPSYCYIEVAAGHANPRHLPPPLEGVFK